MISLLIPTILLIVIIFIVTVSGGDLKKVINAMKNLGTMSSIDMILTCLIVILFVSWVIIAKINSYYDGMYAFSTEDDRAKLNDKSKLPLPYGGNYIKDKATNEFINEINLEGISDINEHLNTISYVCFVLIIAVLIFRNYPISQNNYPGSLGPQNVVKGAIAIIGLIMLVLTYTVFNTSLVSLSDFNMAANSEGRENQTVTINGVDVPYELPKDIKQLYPRLATLDGWWYILLFALVIGTGAAFGTLSANITENAFVTMKNRAELIKDLKNKGALAAFELTDPLFKLIDEAITKKVQMKQKTPVFQDVYDEKGQITRKLLTPQEKTIDGYSLPEPNKIPQLAHRHNIKLFDFVKIKNWKFKKLPERGHGIMSQPKEHAERENSGVFLVAAVNDWTIIPEAGSDRKYAYLGPRTESPQSLRISDEGSHPTSIPGRQPGHPILAFSEKEMEGQEGQPVPYHLNPENAQQAIYGTKDFNQTPDILLEEEELLGGERSSSFKKKGAAARTNSDGNPTELTLIPIDENIFNLSDRFSDNSEEAYTEMVNTISTLLQSQDKLSSERINKILKNSKAKSLFHMVKNIIYKEFAPTLGLRDVRNPHERNPLYITDLTNSPLIFITDTRDNHYASGQPYSEILRLDSLEDDINYETIKDSIPNNITGVMGRKYTPYSKKETDVANKFAQQLSLRDTDRVNPDLLTKVTNNEIARKTTELIGNIYMMNLEKEPVKKSGLGDVSLFKRIKENHTLADLTALDLINLRYSLIENLVFKDYADYKGTEPTDLHILYQNRRKHFPGTQGLLREILPSLKDYVDPAIKSEYDEEVHKGELGLDSSDVVQHEIKSFANRFNAFMGLPTDMNKQGRGGIESHSHKYKYYEETKPVELELKFGSSKSGKKKK